MPLPLLFEATVAFQTRIQQAPNASAKALLAQALAEQTELDDEDYVYLLVFLDALRLAKKDRTHRARTGSRLALLSHAIGEFSLKKENKENQ